MKRRPFIRLVSITVVVIATAAVPHGAARASPTPVQIAMECAQFTRLSLTVTGVSGSKGLVARQGTDDVAVHTASSSIRVVVTETGLNHGPFTADPLVDAGSGSVYPTQSAQVFTVSGNPAGGGGMNASELNVHFYDTCTPAQLAARGHLDVQFANGYR
jgi:hypothetical protein